MEANTRNNDARGTRDSRWEGTGGGRTAIHVAGDLDNEERHAGRSGNDLVGAEFSRLGGGVDKRIREEGFSLALPLLSSARPKSRGS
jgi:hypothetical protein